MKHINGTHSQHRSKTDLTTTDSKPMLNNLHFPGSLSKSYIKAIATQLKTSEKVIRYPMLRSERWTETCYELLAEIVNDDLSRTLSREQRMKMGASLSFRTLQKIMLEEYSITYPIDPRKLNTLNKVVIFLGYDSWSSFKNKVDALQQERGKEKVPGKEAVNVVAVKTHSTMENDPKKEIAELIKTAIRNEYETYCSIPKINEEKLLQTHIKYAPAFNFILDIVMNKKEELVISNAFNPSTFALLDFEVKKMEAAYALVYTKEYWFLCWWDTAESRYTHRYKNISDHFYILNKVNGRWKIKTNASTADPVAGW